MKNIILSINVNFGKILILKEAFYSKNLIFVSTKKNY